MKTEIRRKALRDRKRLSRREVEEKSRRIGRELFSLPEFKRARTAMFYVSLPEEVRTREMIRDALRDGKRVAVPFTGGKEARMVPVLLEDPDRGLAPGRWGVLEPASGEKTVPLEDIDIIVLPGVAFDSRGNRLGRGRAFYDWFLKKAHPRTVRVGLAFEEQIYLTIPACEHDVPVDVIITEDRVISCPPGSGSSRSALFGKPGKEVR